MQDGQELGSIELKNTKITLASTKSGKAFCLQLMDATDDRNYFFFADTAKVSSARENSRASAVSEPFLSPAGRL